jgi:hypothetical protein
VPTEPLNIFISYVHEDEDLVREMETFLRPFVRQGSLSIWRDLAIRPGQDWFREIHQALNRAAIILIMVSSDYLASSVIVEQEMKLALEKAESHEARVVSIILRPSAWDDTPLANLQALPRGARPVTTWSNIDEAWVDVVKGIQYIVEDIRGSRNRTIVEEPRTRGHEILPLYDVFKSSGVPGITFVEPENFSGLKLSIAQPGRGVVVEGPSGIGKTTAIKKAVDAVKDEGDNVNFETLSARKARDVERLYKLQDEHLGTIVVDDFHRLPADLKVDLVDYLKFLADSELEDRKLVIAGIPRTGERLVDIAFDLATRMDVFKLGKVGDRSIIQMIEKGERALNVRFGRRAEIVSAASGSLNIAQLLCYHLCASHAIEKTQTESLSIDADLGGAISRAMEQVAPKFSGMIRFFASLGSRRDLTAIEILKELAGAEDGFLSFNQLEYRRPDLVLGSQRFLDEHYMDHLYEKVPNASNHLLFDRDVPALIIDDPQLTFYLAQTPASTLIQIAGKSEVSRNQVFISYSHTDREWLDRMRIHLKPLEKEGRVNIWDDTRIKSGSRWRNEIRGALDSAKVAIFLVSGSFLASDFIADNELPPLLSAAETEGAVILPLIISPSRFDETAGISQFQTVNSPDRPLSALTYTEQEEIFVELSKRLEEILSEDPDEN